MSRIPNIAVLAGALRPAASAARALHRSVVATAMVLGLGACAGDLDGARNLDSTDLKLIAEVTQQTLETNKVGESANWHNPATGNLGTITPTRTFERDDKRPCRDFQQTATIEGRTRFAYDSACRTADGAWYSLNYDSLADAARHGSAHARRYDPYYDRYYRDPFYDPWCRFPHRDRWCGPRSGFSLGVGSRF